MSTNIVVLAIACAVAWSVFIFYASYRLAFHDIKADNLTSVRTTIFGTIINTALLALCVALFIADLDEPMPNAKFAYIVSALACLVWTVPLYDDVHIIKRTLGFKSIFTYKK